MRLDHRNDCEKKVNEKLRLHLMSIKEFYRVLGTKKDKGIFFYCE